LVDQVLGRARIEEATLVEHGQRGPKSSFIEVICCRKNGSAALEELVAQVVASPGVEQIEVAVADQDRGRVAERLDPATCGKLGPGESVESLSPGVPQPQDRKNSPNLFRGGSTENSLGRRSRRFERLYFLGSRCGQRDLVQPLGFARTGRTDNGPRLPGAETPDPGLSSGSKAPSPGFDQIARF